MDKDGTPCNEGEPHNKEITTKKEVDEKVELLNLIHAWIRLSS